MSLLLPIARRLSDSRLVSPAEVERGMACGCVCPGCQNEVQARQGTEKAWHFAHAEGASHCDKGYEVSVHEMAKQMLRQGGLHKVPAVVAEASDVDEYRNVFSEKREIAPETIVTLGHARTTFRMEDVTPDVAALVEGTVFAMEIAVYHRLSTSKRERLIEARVPCILIDLALFRDLHADREALEHHHYENPLNRTWVFHPDIAWTKPLLEEIIRAKRERARLDILEAQERHRQNDERWEKQQRARAARPDKRRQLIRRGRTLRRNRLAGAPPFPGQNGSPKQSWNLPNELARIHN